MGLTVKLDDKDAAFVQQMIEEGRYDSPDAVAREAMADLRKREAIRFLREAIDQGERDIANGDAVGLAELRAGLEREFGSLDE